MEKLASHMTSTLLAAQEGPDRISLLALGDTHALDLLRLIEETALHQLCRGGDRKPKLMRSRRRQQV